MAQQATKPQPEYLVDTSQQTKLFDLKYPFRLNNIEYRQIALRHPSVREIAEFQKSIEEDSINRLFAPVYADSNGNPIGKEIIECLKHEDKIAIDKVAESFLPEMFQAPTGPSTE